MEVYRLRTDVVSRMIDIDEDGIIQGAEGSYSWLILKASKASRRGVAGEAKIIMGRMGEHKYTFMFWLASEGYMYSDVLKGHLTHRETGEALNARQLFMVIRAKIEELREEFSDAVIGGGRIMPDGEVKSWTTLFFKKETPRQDPQWEALILENLREGMRDSEETSGAFRPSPTGKVAR